MNLLPDRRAERIFALALMAVGAGACWAVLLIDGAWLRLLFAILSVGWLWLGAVRLVDAEHGLAAERSEQGELANHDQSDADHDELFRTMTPASWPTDVDHHRPIELRPLERPQDDRRPCG